MLFGYNIFSLLGATLCDIVEFGKNIDTVIDCWLLYQMKCFAQPDHPLTLNYFPSWNSSEDVSTSLSFSEYFRNIHV